MPSKFRLQLEDWLSKLDIEAKKVLDVGGGQRKLPGRTSSWNVDDYRILDNNEDFDPDFLVDINYPLNQQQGDFNLPEDFAPVESVFCLEVMEYVWNPVVALENLGKLVEEDGKLYISFPFIYPLHPPTGEDYMRYTKYGSKKLLKEAGFEILEYEPRRASSGLLQSYWDADQFKYDSSEGNLELSELGSMIKAKKL